MIKLIVGGLIVIAIIIIVVVVLSVSKDKAAPVGYQTMYATKYDPHTDYQIMDARMLDPGTTTFSAPFPQTATAVGQGIPPEFWDSTRLTTAADCTIIKSGKEIIDCTKDPLTIPDTSIYGRKYHVGNCSNRFGGDGVCKTGEKIGVGIPGLIREYEPSEKTREECAEECYNDPNCAFYTYSAQKGLHPTQKIIQGTCKQYNASAYPFRVKMGPPNDGIYQLNVKIDSKATVEAVDQAVKDANQREVDAYRATLGELTKYSEIVGSYLRGDCFSGGMRFTDNSVYDPLTNWMPIEDVYKCANLCSGSSQCKSFVYDKEYGCLLGKHDQMFIHTGHPTASKLSGANSRIRCGANYYKKK